MISLKLFVNQSSVIGPQYVICPINNPDYRLHHQLKALWCDR